MDLARAPCRAPLTARKKGSGYENGIKCDDTSSARTFDGSHAAPPESRLKFPFCCIHDCI